VAEAAAPGGAARAGAPAHGTPGQGTSGQRRAALRRLCELLALTAFALAQPVLDATGRSPDFFLFRRPTQWQIRALLVLIVLAPPLLLWLAELVAGMVSEVAARTLHLVFTAVLFGIFVVEVGKNVGLFTGAPLAVVGVVAGAALAVALARSEGFRKVVMVATPAPLVFALLFTLTSPAGALVRPSGGGGSAAAAAGNRPPVVFLFLDEFPLRALLDDKGAVDARLFPNFARLAKTSNWYPNATGASGWTPYAAPAMLTGRFPEHGVAPSYVEYPQNLFTLLDGTYDVRAFETIALLCPPKQCSNVPAGRPTGLRPMLRDTASVTKKLISPYRSQDNPTEQFVEATVGTGADEATGGEKANFRFGEAKKNQPDRFTAFVKELKPSRQPTLHFLHLLLPHGPWRYVPSGTTYARPAANYPPQKDKVAGVTAPEPVLSALSKQRLLLQLVYTDGLLGALLDQLQSSGLFDPSLLIVTADHGAGLPPVAHSRQLDDRNQADLAWVPLFVKTPGQKAGKIDRRNEMQVDLVPTIADVLDVKVPWRLDGRSVLGEPRPDDKKQWYDVPGEPKPIDTAKWLPQTRTGYAAEVGKPELGPAGLYAFGPHGGLVGKPLSSLTVGAPSGLTATFHKNVVLDVDPKQGSVPSMLFGDLDKPAGRGQGWLVAAVNGTVAGALPALESSADGKWRFIGMVDDKHFKPGRNDVRLFTVDGTTLHPVEVK
jgi:hypothetical protein